MDQTYKLVPLAELPGHKERAWHLAWNPTRTLLASCSADKSIRMYSYFHSGSSTADGHKHESCSSPSFTFEHISTIDTGHAKTVRAIAWAPSGLTLATASFDSNVGIWEQEPSEDDLDTAREWECTGLLEGHETECKSVGYSASGSLLASCSRDKTVWVWEVHPDSDFECLAVMMEHTQDVKTVVWHPVEEILASASYDDTIKLYVDDPSDDWFCFATLSGHASTVWALAWSPDGRLLASCSDDRSVRIWRPTSGIREDKWECISILQAHSRSVYSISWGRGRAGLGWLASAGSDGRINVWEVKEDELGSLDTKLVSYRDGAHGVHDVNSIAWCPRTGFEDLLASAGDDGVVRTWRISAT